MMRKFILLAFACFVGIRLGAGQYQVGQRGFGPVTSPPNTLTVTMVSHGRGFIYVNFYDDLGNYYDENCSDCSAADLELTFVTDFSANGLTGTVDDPSFTLQFTDMSQPMYNSHFDSPSCTGDSSC